MALLGRDRKEQRGSHQVRLDTVILYGSRRCKRSLHKGPFLG